MQNAYARDEKGENVRFVAKIGAGSLKQTDQRQLTDSPLRHDIVGLLPNGVTQRVAQP